MSSLANRAAIITGSTSGIGLGIAESLAGAGADVMLNGLGDETEIEATRAGLAERCGVDVRYSGANMMKPEEIVAMVREAEEAFGKVDILVNNAGIQYVAPVDEFPVDKWDAIIAINLSATFHAMRAVLPGMKERRFGRIINIASAHALVASPFKAAYVAAKHGVAGLTKTGALEAAEYGVTVNAIAPGYVLTPLVEGQIPDTAKARGITEEEVKRDVLLAAQPTKEFVTVQQLGALAVFLCQPEAASITGGTLPVEGGWTAQ
ncbi:MAG: 3-hydroxybutyrate dehydrogenase [Alphaproteobacteria bacterium]|nr:3-hydroxybutyrate dehydrogenase [Alphaproteobacteria bacterium]